MRHTTRLPRLAILLAALLSLASVAAPARADEDDETSGSRAPMPQRSAGGLEFNWWSARGLVSAFPTVFFLQYAVTPNFVLHGRLPFSWSVFPEGAQPAGHISLGTPMLGADFVKTFGKITFFAGGLLGIPITEDGALRLIDMSRAALARAFADYYYWAISVFPIVPRVGIEARPIDALVLRAKYEPMILVPVGGQSVSFGGRTFGVSRSTEFVHQLHLEGEYRIDSYGFGMALQMVHFASRGGLAGSSSSTGGTATVDAGQLAMEPFVSFDTGSFFGRLGLLTALDEPAGFGFDRGKVMTLRFILGGEFN
jgi:hypothetical protein